VKVSHNFELACLNEEEGKDEEEARKKEERKYFGRLAFLFGTFAMVFHTTGVGVLFIMKAHKDERYIVIKAYKFTVLRVVFSIIIYYMSTLFLNIESINTMIGLQTPCTNTKTQHLKYPLYVTLPQLKSKISCLKISHIHL